MDLLETMYKIKWLEGPQKDVYAYRNTQIIGGIIKTDRPLPWYATVYWDMSARNISDAVWLGPYRTIEEAKAIVEAEWQKHVDAIMEDAG